MKGLALFGVGLALLGCGRKEPVSGVVVQVLSNLDVPAQLDGVELRVDVAGAADVVKVSFSLDTSKPAGRPLPLYYGLYPKQGKGGEFTVTAVGTLNGQEVVRRSASLAFPTAGSTVLLQLPLLASCIGHRCGEGETCVGPAICRSHNVIVADLPPYRRGGGDPIEGDGPDAGDGPSRDTGVSTPPADAGPDRQAPDGPPDPQPADAALDVGSTPPDLGVDVAAPRDTVPPDTTPGCVPRTESCFNGADEDCDMLIDCADPDCVPTQAQCLTIDVDDNGTPGVSIAGNATCPAGFNQATAITIRSGPTGAACSGCACGPAAATCDTAQVFSYQSGATCQADTANSGGLPTTPPTFTRAEGCKVPQYMGGFLGGLRVAPMTPQLGACAASGTATPGAITWAATTKFCPTTQRGGGCPAGRVCVPKPPQTTPPPICALYTGIRACPTGMTKHQNLDWYTGHTDGRTCAACTCAPPTGGSCVGVTIHIGNDYTCNPNNGDLAPGTKMCYPTTIYVPGLRIDGTGTAGSCAPRTSTMGAITPTGPRTICCQ